MLASEMGHYRNVKLILMTGADPSIKSEVSISNKNNEIAKQFIAAIDWAKKQSCRNCRSD